MEYLVKYEQFEEIASELFTKKYKKECKVSHIYIEDRFDDATEYWSVIRKIGKYDVEAKINCEEFMKIMCNELNINTTKVRTSYEGIYIEGEEINMLDNNIDKENLVVVIDMVNGFVKEGALAAPTIQRIVPRMKEILEENEKDERGLNVIVRDAHPKNAIEFKTYGEHCVEGTKEVELIDELKPFENNAIDFTKNSTNFMLANGVIPFLEKCYKLKRIAFVGCLSEVCVKNAAITARNYFDQVNRDVEVLVYADAIDTFNAPGHDADEVTLRALADMEANGVKIYRK